ncbi:MAG TPA: hypothetical protein VLM38_13600 [Blastocatellia bacterium]|nr:hypothetical protein [Blastocatellia bacterium]
MNEPEKMDEVRRLLTETDLTDTKNLDAASDFTSSFEEDGDRAWALGEIAKALAGLGKWDEAEKIASKINLADEQADTLVAIARKLLTSDHRARALRNLSIAAETAKTGKTSWVWQRAFSLLGIARALSEANDTDGALRILEESVRVASAGQQISSHDGEECEGVLGEIAIDLTRLGHLEKAQTVAETIRHPVKRQRTLEAIAEISRGC